MIARVGVQVDVKVEVNDPTVIERIIGPGGDEWREALYPLHTREDVLGHLATNAARNGAYRANQLDGWADLSDDAATMRVRVVGVEGVDVADERVA